MPRYKKDALFMAVEDFDVEDAIEHPEAVSVAFGNTPQKAVESYLSVYQPIDNKEVVELRVYELIPDGRFSAEEKTEVKVTKLL